MRKVQALGILLALALVLARPTLAREVHLFVKNHEFEGPTRLVGRELYAPLDDLLKALGCNWQLGAADGLLLVQSGSADKPGQGPALSQVATPAIDGRLVRVNQHLFDGRVFVDVHQFARVLGAPFRLNLTASTADLYTPLAFAGPRDQAVRTNGDGRNSPLLLDKLSYQVDPDPEHPNWRQMRGYVQVRNRSQDQKLTGVIVRVVVVDASGRPLGRFAEALGSLGPGEQATYQFPVWTDLRESGALAPHPTVELDHQP